MNVVAHTSPIYVQLDGDRRFDGSASQFWIYRMRQHANDIRGRGRFADDSQRQEAVDYIEQGIRMFRDLELHRKQSRSRTETVAGACQRIGNVVRRLGVSQTDLSATLSNLSKVGSKRDLREALEPLIILEASVNPESRLKLTAAKNRITVRQGRPQRFLVAIENTAGVTAPLQIEAFDLSESASQVADWIQVKVIDSPYTSLFLTGAEHEYKVVEVLVREGGLREIRLVGNVGQGTQDLGFRATADLMIDAEHRPSRSQLKKRN